MIALDCIVDVNLTGGESHECGLHFSLVLVVTSTQRSWESRRSDCKLSWR